MGLGTTMVTKPSPLLLGVLLALPLMCTSQTVTALSQACCGVALMDAGGRVVIEDAPIPRQLLTFMAIRIRLCTQEELRVQIYRREKGSGRLRYTLVWETTIQADEDDLVKYEFVVKNMPTMVKIPQEDSSVTYHLGLFVRTPFVALPVPYTFDKVNGVYTSEKRFDMLAGGAFEFQRETIMMDMVLFPRSHNNYLYFCAERGCTDFPLRNVGVDGIVGPQGPKGDKGDPGPQGPPGPPGSGNVIGPNEKGEFPGDQFLSDYIIGVGSSVTGLSQKTDALDAKLNQVMNQLNSISKAEADMGYCPGGFEPGSRGLSSCYKFYDSPQDLKEMGAAFIHCVSGTKNAHLVDIDTPEEESFLVSKIKQRSGSPDATWSYWTSAMYALTANQWVWLDNDQRKRRMMTGYKNWENGEEPFNATEGIGDKCMSMDFNLKTNVGYWTMRNCKTKRYYICEAPRLCY